MKNNNQEFDLSQLPVTALYRFINMRTSGDRIESDRFCTSLVCKLDGVSVYNSNGKIYTLDANHAILLPKHSSYTVRRESEGSFYMVEFELADGFEPSPDRLYLWELTNPQVFTRLFTEAERIWTFKKTAYYNRASALLYQIFAELERESRGFYLESSSYERIRSAGQYLESNLSNPGLSIEMLAEVAGLSESYFRKLFSQVYKYSPGQYISMVRIEKAKDLLSSGECRINEIAEQVGFSSIYYFSAAFKRAVGVSPSEYAQTVGQAFSDAAGQKPSEPGTVSADAEFYLPKADESSILPQY